MLDQSEQQGMYIGKHASGRGKRADRVLPKAKGRSGGTGGSREGEIHPGEKGVTGNRVHTPASAYEQIAQTALVRDALERQIRVRPDLRNIHPQHPVAAKGQVQPAHERSKPAVAG